VLTIRALNREGEIGVATIHRPSTNQWRAPDTKGMWQERPHGAGL
jgi:hypothetical protein